MTIQVDANLFRLVYGAVSTEETRYYLNGVHIEPHPEKGAILVSTDGHRMIVAHDEKAVCDEIAIVKLPRFVLAQCRAPKMFETKRLLEVDGTFPGSATIVDIMPGIKAKDEPKRSPVVTSHRVIIDGKFPDWRRVVPKDFITGTSVQPTAFNPKYLREWGALGLELAKISGGNGTLQIGLSDSSSPTVIRYGGAPHVFAVQMPMRWDRLGGFLPAFMDAQPAAKAELQAAE